MILAPSFEGVGWWFAVDVFEGSFPALVHVWVGLRVVTAVRNK